MINPKFLEFIRQTIVEEIQKILSTMGFCIIRSAVIVGTPTTTATIRFVGDTVDTPSVRFINGLILANTNKVNVLIYNGSLKNTSMLILEKI